MCKIWAKSGGVGFRDLTWNDSNTILVLKLLRNQHDRAHAHSLIEINVDITDYVAKFTDMLLANLVKLGGERANYV